MLKVRRKQMKTSAELKKFVDEHDLYVVYNNRKNTEKRYNLIASLLRTEETAKFALVCNGVRIKKDKKTVAYFSGTGYIGSGGLLVFTNKRVIATDFSEPKVEAKYHTFQFEKNPDEQNWDVIAVKGNLFIDEQVIVKIDDGTEIQLLVSSKKGKYVAEELSKFLSSLA